jgi:prophage maintenance system killer protein
MNSENDEFSSSKNSNLLKAQLEHTRFLRALEICDSLVEHRIFLTTTELARINNVLTGEQMDPWRVGVAVCVLPSGKQKKFDVCVDPINKAKDVLTYSKQLANSDPIEAATYLYTELVLNHVFKDANRRTAVIACAYLLKFHGYNFSALALHNLGLGDLQLKEARDSLKNLITQIIQFNKIHEKT